VAFIKCDFISICELVNFFVRRPELNSGSFRRTALKLVLSHKVLVVKGIEVSSLSFVGELG
jgi:hypothetical protein